MNAPTSGRSSTSTCAIATTICSTAHRHASRTFSSSPDLLSGGEAAQAEAVGDDEHRGERHGCAGDHRVEQACRGEGEGGDVVREGPEQVALDDAQGTPGQADRV